MSDKKTDPNEEDDATLFRQSVADARPLAQKNTVQHPPRTTPASIRRRQCPEKEPTPLQDRLSDEYRLETVAAGDALFFSRPGLKRSVVKKLRRGQLPIDAALDLHGMVVTEAREALQAFIDECQTSSTRCARIVHGKGHGSSSHYPVLKNRVNGWLREIDAVLAFCSAQPKDGGTGALYVLLKKGSSNFSPLI